MSIKVRLTISFLVVIVVPVMVLLTWSNKTISDTLLEQISETELHAVEGCSQSAGDVFTDMSRLLVSMSSDDNVRRLMNNELSFGGNDSGKFKYEQMVFAEDIMESTQMLLMKSPFTLMVIPQQGQCFGNRENISSYAQGLRATPWYEEVNRYKDSSILWLDPLNGEDQTADGIFRAAIPVKKTMTSMENIGIIYIEISEKYIYNAMTRGDRSAQVYLLDLNNRLTSAADKDLIGKDFPFPAEALPGGRSGWQAVDYQGDRMVVAYSSPLMDKWQAVSATPYSQIFSRIDQVQGRLYIITLVLLTVFVLIAFASAWHISEPVVRLSRKMNLVEGGELTVRAEETGRGEIGVLQKSFNRMLSRICELMQRLKEEEKAKREAEIDALQAQINPHFLFNVLSSIRWAAAAGESNVEEMVLQLSSLLKMSIKKGTDQVPMGEECAMLRQYVDLHNLRHQRTVDLQISIGEEEQGALIPRFILQPLVENSIIHGFHSRFQGCRIAIAAGARNGRMTIYVEDNGEGLPPDFEIGKKETASRRAKDSFSSIGLANVRDRIRLYYGEETLFVLESITEGGVCEGTRVVIGIPYCRDEEELC